MPDINAEIEKDLKDIGIEPVFFYPQNFYSLPAVSFYTLNEKTHISYDNSEALSYGAVQIDIWDKNPAVIGRVFDKIKNSLIKKNWVREFSMDIPPDDEGVFHKTVRFSKIF